MPVYHQMGHHSENLLLVPELNRYAGAILSPVNYAENEIAGQIRLAERIGEFECLARPTAVLSEYHAGPIEGVELLS